RRRPSSCPPSGGLARFGAAPAEEFADLFTAPRRDRTWAGRPTQGDKSRLDHVVRVWAADRLCHHAVHTERLENRAHRAAGDDPGPRLGGAHDHVAGTVAADDVVMERAALAQRHADHAAPRLLGGLANGFGHFSGLT